MKLLPDAAHGPSITGYGLGWVAVNGEQFQSSLVLSARTGAQVWSCTSFEELQAGHFEELAALEPELVLFGSGTQLRFPHAGFLRGLYSRRIGVETMDTAAACRTFNFLAAEGRHVVAALLLQK